MRELRAIPSLLVGACCGLLTVVAFALCIFAVEACAGVAVNENEQYASQQNDCVLMNSTKETIDACLKANKVRWDCHWAAEYPDSGLWTCVEGGTDQ